ncbi:uncharacterized protein [Typha angustifolia]|uniref:uncharacterized protein isoform X2 n=1 Tax=Typha angustifolia TaxID=59011 RepID=UPI003C302CD7
MPLYEPRLTLPPPPVEVDENLHNSCYQCYTSDFNAIILCILHKLRLTLLNQAPICHISTRYLVQPLKSHLSLMYSNQLLARASKSRSSCSLLSITMTQILVLLEGNARRNTALHCALKVWSRPEGDLIHVNFNSVGQPVGKEATTLSSFLGTIARDGKLAPLIYVDWRALPDENKDIMWQVVQSLGKKWKDWKSDLKHDHYETHETDEDRLADRDLRVLAGKELYK